MINELCKLCNDIAVEHGFDENTPGEQIALMHSELSEALEEIRNGLALSLVYPEIVTRMDGEVDRKPCGVPIELADCVIRIMHFCGKYGIDLESAILEKIEYNKERPYKHGRTM